MGEYFQKLKSLGANVKFQSYFINYATKADSKSATGVDTLDFAKKTDLANSNYHVDKLDIDKLKYLAWNLSQLKSKFNKLDIGKLETTPVDLSKLCNVLNNDVAKRTEYDELVKRLMLFSLLMLVI